MLTLHDLVWAKKLPYAIDAYWMQGGCIRDKPFYFVSDLGAVTRLRKLLRTHGMGRLADRIKTGTYRGSVYVMLNLGNE